ncbi:AraC family transcriptional regulator [Paenibacillus silviterrae]|uniref:AraC family transcriptional regulator n=1 Tax=Paenibacillus silviterrae TaxID=3242194 RepID=UPI0025432805|nr:helix-turn-helix domain-containing protein [Paenibacillus chinjuensis]
MPAIKAFMLKKSFLIRIIISYLIVGLLVVGALTMIIIYKVSGHLTDEINTSTNRAMEQSYNAAQILINSTYSNFASAYTKADIQVGFYSDHFTTTDMGRIGARLSELAGSNPLVHSVYVVNQSERLVFSSLSTARGFSEFYDQDVLSLLETTQPYRSGIFIPRHARFQVDGREVDKNLISILYLSIREDRVTNGAMVLNLDQDVLQQTVMNGTGSASFQSMILNQQGTVISHSDSRMLNTNLSGTEYVRSIIASEEQKGNLKVAIDGKDSRVFYMKSDTLGWIFIGNVNYDQLLSKVNELQSYILGVTAIMLIMVMISGIFFTRMIYGPIHRLLTKVRSASPGTPSDNVSELDLLSGTFAYLENKIQDLQSSVAGYQSVERLQLLRLLTQGGWSGEQEMTRKLQSVGIALPYDHFRVVLLRLDGYSALTDRYPRADISLLKYAVSNIAEELGRGRGINTVCFEDEADALTLLINLPEAASFSESRTEELLREIQSNVSVYLKLSVSAAIGTPAQGMLQIPDAWQGAYQASRYRIVQGMRCLIGADMEETRESLQDSLSGSLEKQITDQMKLGDMEKTRQAVREYMGVLRNAPYDEMMLLLTQLLIATARTVRTMAASEEQTFDIGLLSQRLNRSETLEQIEVWYLELCEKAVSLRDKQSSQKNRLIVDKVRQYIHEHYADPNLSIETLVQVGGLSANYMRKVFKDMEGQSITTYVNHFRFAKAKQLLTTTDLPANKIGEMVGFDNTNYFYVSFKKHCGKTPDHYRKSLEPEDKLL